MKKILALVLACVMLASMFTVNAFAATPIVGTGVEPNRVGSATAAGTTDNDVSVAVKSVTSQYYVDIDYTIPTYELPAITWNVQDLEYVADGAYTDGNFDTDTTLTIKNYSDVAVKVAITIEDKDTSGYITVTGATVAPVEVGGYNHAAGYGDADEVGEKTFNLDVNCSNPVLAAKHYQGETSVVVATYTVTIS